METLRNDRTGETLRVLESTGERLRFEFWLQPGASIPGTHMHPRSEQRITVSQGILHLRVARRHAVIEPGESLTVPAATSHFQWNPGAVPVCAMEEYRPAGRLHEMFATFFRLAGEGLLTPSGRVASPLLAAAFFSEFRDEVRATPRLFQWGLESLAPLANTFGYRRRVARSPSDPVRS